MLGFDLDGLHETLATLRKNKLRTLMTASGVFWGVFMLVAMLGFGRGLQDGVGRNMLGFVSNSVFVWGQRTNLPFKGFGPGRRVQLDNGDTEALERELDQVLVVAPRTQLGGWRDGNNISYAGNTGNFGVMGEIAEFADIQDIRPYAGRFINQLDIDQRRKVAVIGEQVKSVLFGDDPAVGKAIKIKGMFFQVIGVDRSALPGEQGERANATVHVPFTTFQTAFNAKNVVGWFALLVEPDGDSEAAERQARAVIARRHSVAPGDEGAIGSFNAAKMVRRVSNMFLGIEFFIWFVGAFTLLAGALGVSNIMLISVRERTVEFGVRKALGATPWSVVSLVLKEAALLTTLAGYGGLVVAVVALEAVPRFFAEGDGPLGTPSVDFRVALGATAVLALAGVLAGVAPARRAARIRPVEALRAE
jgi:putative ABC transport system permease protein